MKRIWILGLLFLTGCCQCHKPQQPVVINTFVGYVRSINDNDCINLTLQSDDGTISGLAFTHHQRPAITSLVWAGAYLEIKYTGSGQCTYGEVAYVVSVKQPPQTKGAGG